MEIQGIEVAEVKRVLRKHKKIILGLVLVTVLMVFIGNQIATPIYEATTAIMVIGSGESGPESALNVLDKARVVTNQKEIIKSYPVLEEVVRRLRLDEQKGLIKPDPLQKLKGSISDSISNFFSGIKRMLGKAKSPQPVDNVRAMVGQLQGKKTIRAENVVGSDIILVSVCTDESAEATQIANTLAEVHVTKNIETKRKRISSMADFVDQQLGDARERLRDAEERLRKFKEEVKIVDSQSAEPAKNLFTRKEELERDLRKFDTERQVLKAQGYKDEHPDIKSLDTKIEALKNNIKNVEEQLEGYAKPVLTLARLTRVVEACESVYKDLIQRKDKIHMMEATVVPDVEIVSRAQEPDDPIKPKKTLNLIIGIIVSLMMGCSIALVLEYFDRSIKSERDIRVHLDLPVLGSVSIRPGDVSSIGSGGPLPEDYRKLRISLLLTEPSRSSQTIMVVSPNSGVGVTQVASNLAWAMALREDFKVLLIDTNFRKPSLHRVFGLDNTYGLVDYCTGAVTEEQIILKKTKVSGLVVITAGQIPDNPAELLDSGKMRSFVERIKSRYNLVLFDSSPVISYSDSLIMGTYLDRTIMVVCLGKTIREEAQKTKDLLQQTKCKLEGVILTQSDYIQ